MSGCAWASVAPNRDIFTIRVSYASGWFAPIALALAEYLAHGGKQFVRHFYHAGAPALKGRFVFGYGCFFALALIVGEQLAYALLIPARGKLVLRLHRPFLRWRRW